MKLTFLIPLVFGMIYCKCAYNGSYSKVFWDVEKEAYVQKIMDLGEQSIFAEFTFCYKKGKVLKLEGRVNNQDTFIGNSEFINTEIMILRCDRDGIVKDTITTTDQTGLFNIETVRDKKGFLVFKEKNKHEGVRYDIRLFR